MSWLQLRIDSSASLAPQYEEELLALGAVAVTLQDNADQPLFDKDLEQAPLWSETRITGLFPADTDTQALWQELPQTLREASHYRAEILEDKDWEREWMQHYQPLQITPQVWICPSWLTPPDPAAINVMLDPGLAFGTGTHPTTAMCVAALADMELHGKQVIDYGCGSGILAIAALLLGAATVTGIDTDPQAVQATRNNAECNHVDPHRIEVGLPGLSIAPAPLMVANILAGPLCQLAPTLCELLEPEGEMLLSGILAEQVNELVVAYQPWLNLSVLREQDGWVVLYGQRQ
ncbi:50S ribosomal protein L11 methyltransferase [Halieaceae bacterium IMCC14734]|uniref:Ribosomal protein L11 methyltransferase n=1 Tax=Candidatus Litorirhabdus singularis TaxID=2518993 RepID=A0ABT3TPT4_9GAMM|nr:50S ribosomal protein L11 methyltransferase [Candidatus Litorirhabdus singularis]MCX2983342.1 50S ribosomal protein L11 methyltransferase [Candidatus Litorirhabdus singularis]